MILLVTSAALVGLIHSLAPGHWLPVVLVTKARNWSKRTAMLGALTAASGHIFISVSLGIIGIKLGAELFVQYEEEIERYSGLVLVAFGLMYALLAYFSHVGCRGHTHHGPEPETHRGPFAFLFTLGLSPCVAVLPVFVAAAPMGVFPLLMTMLAFSLGVMSALIGATLLVTFGVMRLDHPILEHYGDVITGTCVALMGVLLFFFHH